jgi:hypothetical protein
MFRAQDQEGDPQDNFVEARDPSELVMCTILAAAYAGLAKYCWEPLRASGNYGLLFNIEGFFITTSLLALLVGLRPYLSPCSLQISGRGIKYRGPYWPQRKTINWDLVLRIYVSPELIIVLHHPKPASKIVWPMFIQSVYLSDKDKVADAVIRHSPLPSIRIAGPNWKTRLILIILFVLVVIWILEMLLGGIGH